MNEAALITAFELLDDFLTEGKAAPVWLVVGGVALCCCNGLTHAKQRTWT